MAPPAPPGGGFSIGNPRPRQWATESWEQGMKRLRELFSRQGQPFSQLRLELALIAVSGAVMLILFTLLVDF